MSNSTSPAGVVHLIQPSGEYWGRSYTTGCVNRDWQRPGVAGGAERSRGSGRYSLDRCTYDAPGTPPANATGEWYVALTQVDGYGEFIAVDDADGNLRRRVSSKRDAEKPQREGCRSSEDVESLRLEKLEAAGRRAKRNCKWKVRMLRADRLWTLTTRGGIRTRADAWALWGQFERYCSRRFPGFKCVVVMEPHLGGGANHLSWHIHFCTNRFFPVDSMRLWWHRILTGVALTAPRRGEESPGNIDVSRVLGGGKLCAYLGKYLAKSLADDLGGEPPPTVRIKRFACSKGIGEPTRTTMRMHARCGTHVYRLRCLAEAAGWKVEALFEGTVAGRALVWMKCKLRAGGSEAAGRPDPAALVNALRAGYS